MGPHQGHVASRGVQLGAVLVTCTSKTFRLCAAGRYCNPLTPGLSPLCRFGSNPVAEQYLTVEDGCLSPPGFRQQSSVAEHFLAVEDGFTSSSKLLKTVSGVSNISFTARRTA